MSRPVPWLSCRNKEWARRPELRRRCAWLHHGAGPSDPPDTRLRRDDPRPMAGSPSIVPDRLHPRAGPSQTTRRTDVPVPSQKPRDSLRPEPAGSVPPCSLQSRIRAVLVPLRGGLRPSLTCVARGGFRTAGRDKGMVAQIEQWDEGDPGRCARVSGPSCSRMEKGVPCKKGT